MTEIDQVNAAGSFYALIFVPMLWWAWRERSLLWMAAAGLIGPALWMTGSRAALVAAVGSVFVAWLLTERPHRRWIGIAILVTLPLAALAILNPARANVGVGLAFDVRRDMTVVAIELAAERPLFGLGFGGFRRESPAKATPAMLAVFPQLAAGENAHNNYLQVLVEFGLVGLLAVLVLLSRGFRRWPLVRDSPPDHVQSGLEAGLVAFCLTCLAGHPWLTPQVLVPFGAVLGLAAAGAGVASTRPRLPAAVAVLLALLAVSTPLRLRASSGDPSLGGVVVGGTEESADGPGWRRFDGRGRWFVPGDARVVIFAGQSVDATGPCAVTVRVDGEPVPAGVAWVGEQLRIRLALAPSTVAEHARRIDLRFGDGDCRVSMAPIEVRRLR